MEAYCGKINSMTSKRHAEHSRAMPASIWNTQALRFNRCGSNLKAWGWRGHVWAESGTKANNSKGGSGGKRWVVECNGVYLNKGHVKRSNWRRGQWGISWCRAASLKEAQDIHSWRAEMGRKRWWQRQDEDEDSRQTNEVKAPANCTLYAISCPAVSKVIKTNVGNKWGKLPPL